MLTWTYVILLHKLVQLPQNPEVWTPWCLKPWWYHQPYAVTGVPHRRNGSSREQEKTPRRVTAWRKTSTPRRGAKSHGKHGSQNTGRNLRRVAFLKEEGPTNLRMTKYLSRNARFKGSSWLKWMKPEKRRLCFQLPHRIKNSSTIVKRLYPWKIVQIPKNQAYLKGMTCSVASLYVSSMASIPGTRCCGISGAL